MATQNWVNIGSGNGLYQAINCPSIDQPLVWSNDNYPREVLQGIPQSSITNLSLKMTYSTFYFNVQGANELTIKM